MPHKSRHSAGRWFLGRASIDYLLRVTENRALRCRARTYAAAAPEAATPSPSALLLRTLRLNCLTTAYGDLWSELYEDAWRDESWVVNWPNIAPLGDRQPDVGARHPAAHRVRAPRRARRDRRLGRRLARHHRGSSLRRSTRPATRSSATTRKSPGSTPPAGSSPVTGIRSAPARPRSTGSSSRRTKRTRRRTRPLTDIRHRSTRPTGSASTGRRTPSLPSV